MVWRIRNLCDGVFFRSCGRRRDYPHIEPARSRGDDLFGGCNNRYRHRCNCKHTYQSWSGVAHWHPATRSTGNRVPRYRLGHWYLYCATVISENGAVCCVDSKSGTDSLSTSWLRLLCRPRFEKSAIQCQGAHVEQEEHDESNGYPAPVDEGERDNLEKLLKRIDILPRLKSRESTKWSLRFRVSSGFKHVF